MPYEVLRAMHAAMRKMQRLGRGDPPPHDFGSIEFAAAWEWMSTYRGVGKNSAYGPAQQAVNDDANSHALRGFMVGWAMCEAMHAAMPTGEFA